MPAYNVSRLCGTGLEAINTAARWIECGDAEIILAGGTENMTMLPFYVRQGRYGYRLGDAKLEDGILSLLSDPFSRAHMGITAENLADKYGISRQDQDELSLRSHQNAVAAIESRSLQGADRAGRGEGGPRDEVHSTSTKGRGRTRTWKRSASCGRRSRRAETSPPATPAASTTARPLSSS